MCIYTIWVLLLRLDPGPCACYHWAASLASLTSVESFTPKHLGKQLCFITYWYDQSSKVVYVSQVHYFIFID